VRVLYELAHSDVPTAAEIGQVLAFDAGYLSRILRRFEERGLLARRRSKRDGRETLLGLTARGRATFAALDKRARVDVGALLAPLSPDDQRRVSESMQTIETLLGQRRAAADSPVTLRPLQPGDLGWVVQRHGALYAEEYGWDEHFEGLVARIVADYVDHHDPRGEDAWLAELDGEPVGCVFCVRRDDHAGQLRLLLVEPKARGLGIGARLVEECIRFARRAGYDELVLWTNDVLVAARRIYEAAGFTLVDEEPHHSFGHDLVGQNWRLDLRAGRGDVEHGRRMGGRLLV